MAGPESLLSQLGRVITATYGLTRPGSPLETFVIGDRGLLTLHADHWAEGRDLSRPGEAMVLLREEDDDTLVSLYYPDALIENLERHDPRRGLCEENLRDFAVFVEELDHLLVLADASANGRQVAAVELELHANVTVVLTADLFHARSLGLRRLPEEESRALRTALLDCGDYEGEESSGWRQRYLDARRAAWRFLDRLFETPRGERHALLQRFSGAPLPEKLALCAA
ncbi:MAG: hypothetical protein AAF533_03545 [Acidobacteriota bacterium]